MGAGDVLDVGCGTGTLFKRARRDGHPGRLVGLDPGAGMLAVAREEPSVEWVEGELVTFAEITDGGRWHDQVDLSTLRFLPRIELDRFLAEAGMRVETYYGDWERGPLTEDSQEIVVIARRSAL